jgi:hypothetical protein
MNNIFPSWVIGYLKGGMKIRFIFAVAQKLKAVPENIIADVAAVQRIPIIPTW